jgi:hypothetical protein
MTTKLNRTTTVALDAKILLGIQKDLLTYQQIPLGQVIYNPATLATFYQSRIDAANQVATTKAAWQHAVANYEALVKQGALVTTGLKAFVMGIYGKTGPQLADFGFTPPKTATLTPEQKAAAVAKRAATRKARGTVGPKAKLAITGATAAASAAATAPATPAPAAGQPAPAAAPQAPAPAPAPVGPVPPAPVPKQ